MDKGRIDKTVALLLEMRRTGHRISSIPEDFRPASIEDGHAVQDALIAATGARIGGWKVNAPPGKPVVRGAIELDRMFRSPARVPAARMGMLGIEGEIAFRFPDGLPPRTGPYGHDEVAAAATALAALDIVDSRFESFMQVTVPERIADGLNLGGFVAGAELRDWAGLDLAGIEAVLAVDGREVSRHRGQHPAGDPFAPAVALANALRHADGLAPGHIVTTGSCTGLFFAAPGQTVVVSFAGIGPVSVTFIDDADAPTTMARVAG